MTLQQDLDAFRAEFERTAPAGRAALYDAKVAELTRDFPLDRAAGVGDAAPDFTLPDAHGRPQSLAAALAEGPVVVTFYRGGWCPYCNIQLRAYQAALPELAARGARLMAISPQTPDGSLSTAEKNALSFDVLSDGGNAVAGRFGLVYTLPTELQDALSKNGKALPGINGDDSWTLPLTGTFVVGRDGRIALAWVDTDYRRRLEPAQILAALDALAASTDQTKGA